MPTHDTRNAPRAVAIVSGGLDSVTLAHALHGQGYALHLLTVNYGQRHKREIVSARACAKRLHAKHTVLNMAHIGRALLHGSALTSPAAVDVPHGHYAAESMRATVVPNRNAILLALAYGLAVAEDAAVVAIGVHAGDHFIYPDCRPAFTEAFDTMERFACEGFAHPALRLVTPFIHGDKAEIVRIGHRLGVPFAETWSCYEGGALHCGQCGTCVERREAFMFAGVDDPTEYANE